MTNIPKAPMTIADVWPRVVVKIPVPKVAGTKVVNQTIDLLPNPYKKDESA